MMDKKFIEFVANKLNIERQELVEKDIILQGILRELVKNVQFKEKFAFKGGTCLIKCYFGYYRFSEDLDFSYINQNEFKGKSEKTIRKMLSQKIDLILGLLVKISNKFGLDFKADKTDSHYVEYGGGNKFVTFKIWYDSAILNQKAFVKIQINFVEKLFHLPIETAVNSIIGESLAKEIKFIFREQSFLLEPVNIKAYLLNEILLEKVRAIITRRGIKARDFVDIYLIQKETKCDLRLLEKEIVEKIIFMLKYEKYIQNIKNKPEQLEKEFVLGREEALLLKPLPADFKKFLEESKPLLKDIINKVLEKVKDAKSEIREAQTK